MKVGLPREHRDGTLRRRRCTVPARWCYQTGEHPAKPQDEVTTPAGTTIDGILELEDGGLRDAHQGRRPRDAARDATRANSTRRKEHAHAVSSRSRRDRDRAVPRSHRGDLVGRQQPRRELHRARSRRARHDVRGAGSVGGHAAGLRLGCTLRTRTPRPTSTAACCTRRRTARTRAGLRSPRTTSGTSRPPRGGRRSWIRRGLRALSFDSGTDDASGTSLRIGVGAGARRKAGDSGTPAPRCAGTTIRARPTASVVVNPGGSVITFKLGFDLWLKSRQ